MCTSEVSLSRIRVPNHSVKKNLEVFGSLQRERKPEVPKKNKRTVFYASVDRESGEILFQDFTPGCEVISNKEWKPVCLRLCDSIGENGERKFEILEMGKEGKPFVSNDLRPRARDIVDLTIKALNELLLQARKSLDPEFFLRSACGIRVARGGDGSRYEYPPLCLASSFSSPGGKNSRWEMPGMFSLSEG